MIELSEQFVGSKNELNDLLNKYHQTIFDDREECSRFVKRLGENALCFRCSKKGEEFHMETSYFVGVDWMSEGTLPIYVYPKQNIDKNTEVDYLNMLNEALQERENIDHLSDLVHIDFDKQYIKISQQQDMLSIFLVTEYIQLIKRIVSKGLRKSYYNIEENLNSRVKGKILVNKNIVKNTFKGKITNVYCRYQEYGVDNNENRILKHALSFVSRILSQYKGIDTRCLSDIIKVVKPAFINVSDKIHHDEIINCKPSPIYKEYSIAIKIAQLILKRYSYNISKVENTEVHTPPFWIDMSKLFELYVYKKLRDVFEKDEIMYHLKARKQELDYLLNPKESALPPFVIDAKYKPRYHIQGVETNDIRQICGYARLKRVYKELGLDNTKNIDCLVIYSHQDCPKNISLTLDKSTFLGVEQLKDYVGVYKLGISLPEIYNKRFHLE